MHNILGLNINSKEVQAFLVFSWSCWKTLMVAFNKQHKTRSFLHRGEKQYLPEIIYVIFTLNYVHEQQTKLLQGVIQIKYSKKTMSSQHVSKQY